MPPKRAIGNEEPPFNFPVVLYNEESCHNTVVLKKDYKKKNGKKARQLETVPNGFVLNVVGKAPDNHPYYEVRFKSKESLDSGTLTKGYCKKTHCWRADEEDLRAQKVRNCASSSSSQRPPDVAPPPPPTPQLPANRHDSQSVKSELSESEGCPPGCVDPTSLCSGDPSHLELHRVIRSSNKIHSDYLPSQTFNDAWPPPTPQHSQSVKSESESESEPAPEGRPGCVDYPTSLCSGNRSMELHRVIRSSNSDYLGQTLCDACLGEVLLARPFIKTRPLKDEGP